MVDHKYKPRRNKGLELMKKYRVYENQLTLILETDDKTEATARWRQAHRDKPDCYHELFEYWSGQYNGIAQFEPNDTVRW